MDVLVEGSLIKQIDQGLKADKKAIAIDGDGRTLMPGLIDGHAHVMTNGDYGQIETNMDLTDLACRATRVMERFLMDGFTSDRNMSGPTFGLQRNTDADIVPGPRLYPSAPSFRRHPVMVISGSVGMVGFQISPIRTDQTSGALVSVM